MMFETSDRVPESRYNQAPTALQCLVEKITEKVTSWAKKLMREIAKKAVDWISNAIKTGVDTLANQIKIALQPEPLITPESTLTEPAVTALESGSVTKAPPLGERLAQEKQEQLASNPQPLATDFTNQLVAQLAAYRDQQADGFTTPILIPSQQSASSFLLVSAAA